MDTHTREAIVAAYEARYERDRKRMQGADEDAIAEAIAHDFGVTSAAVTRAVLDDAARLRGTL